MAPRSATRSIGGGRTLRSFPSFIRRSDVQSVSETQFRRVVQRRTSIAYTATDAPNRITSVAKIHGEKPGCTAPIPQCYRRAVPARPTTFAAGDGLHIRQ